MGFGYNYGDQAGSTIARPVCWGKDFNDNSAECRGCPFTATCKDHVIKANVNRPMTQYQQPMPVPLAVPQVVPAPVYPTYQMPAAPQMPIYGRPPQQQPLVQAMPIRPAPATPAPATVVHQPQQLAPHFTRSSPYQDWYGAVQDPLFYAVTTAPPLLRPQMQGETYVQRWVKNVGLSMLEAGLMHTFLAVRQLMLPPEQPEQPDIAAQFRPPGT